MYGGSAQRGRGRRGEENSGDDVGRRTSKEESPITGALEVLFGGRGGLRDPKTYLLLAAISFGINLYEDWSRKEKTEEDSAKEQ